MGFTQYTCASMQRHVHLLSLHCISSSSSHVLIYNTHASYFFADASFAESFYGLKRIRHITGIPLDTPTHRTHTQLTRLDRQRALGVLVFIPYVKSKLEAAYRRGTEGVMGEDGFPQVSERRHLWHACTVSFSMLVQHVMNACDLYARSSLLLIFLPSSPTSIAYSSTPTPTSAPPTNRSHSSTNCAIFSNTHRTTRCGIM